MAFIPIPNTVLVRLYLKTAVAELKASLSLYFFKTGFTDEDMSDLLDDLASGFVPALMTPIDEDYTAYLLEAYDMNAADGYKVSKVIDIDGLYTEGTPVSPAQCLVMTFRGNKRGKWNTGRNYIPGLSEDYVDQVDVQDAVAAMFQAVYQDLIDDPPIGWTWVIASRYKDGLPRETGVVMPVDSCLVRSNRFGFQRRRAQRP
jgi:hypothetical protein